MSSLIAPVLAKVKACDTSFVIWIKLDTLFASKTDAHLIHLKESLSPVKKGSSTIQPCLITFNQSKILWILLPPVVLKFLIENFVIMLLRDLIHRIESIVSSLITMKGVITAEEFESMPLSYDLRVTAQN